MPPVDGRPRLAYHARYLDAGCLSTPVRRAPPCAPERPRISGDRSSGLHGRSRAARRRHPATDRSHGARDAAGPVGLAPVHAGSHRPTRQRADASPARAGLSRRCQPRRDRRGARQRPALRAGAVTGHGSRYHGRDRWPVRSHHRVRQRRLAPGLPGGLKRLRGPGWGMALVLARSPPIRPSGRSRG